MSDQINKINKKATVNLEELLKSDAPYLVEDGKVNLEKLKGLLTGKTTEKEDDRFYFNWAGKDKVFQAIQAPAYSTLAPRKDKSIGWDETENLMIVGENLETLKLLLKPYFGKVKVIYIDPPYNTGKDFIYKDDFSAPLKDYLGRTGQKGDDGTKLTTNSETNGRYHSDWLNFMYPRLFIARNLLRDDGVIFISIDDNEIHHLRMIMDEIFGEDNFLIGGVVNKASEIASNWTVSKHEYFVTYLKDFNKFSLKGRERYTLSRGTVGNENQTMPIITFPAGLRCINVKDGIYSTTRKIKGGRENIENLDTIIVKNGLLVKEVKLKAKWRSSNDMRNFFNNKCQPTKAKINGVIEEIYLDGDRFMPIIKKRVIEKISSLLLDNKRGSKDLEKIGLDGVFDYPKSVGFLKQLFSSIANDNDIILDFFAGSGTTGHAVFELNEEDGGNRQFILVQLDEAVDETKESGRKAKKLGLYTVADICVERLKRLSKKNEKKLKYKIFKLSSSNFNLKEEFELTENKDLGELKTNYLKELGLYVDQPTVATASTLDIVYEIILKNGFSLNSKIEELKLGSNNFYKVSDAENELEIYLSLDVKLEDKSVEAIRTTEYKSKTFAFYDNALTDSQKINLNTFVKLQVI